MSKDETLVDLYCGVGTLTSFVGRDADAAYGVERNPEAVSAAQENAKRNGLRNIEFICADVEAWDCAAVRPGCVIIDPPRKGMSVAVVGKILEMAPRRIVYISCDPATFARDIKALGDAYVLADAVAVDMFPRTANVECCSLLLRK